MEFKVIYVIDSDTNFRVFGKDVFLVHGSIYQFSMYYSKCI
jgi:hypothetical protein